MSNAAPVRYALVALAVFAGSAALAAQDWPQILGPGRNGIYTGSPIVSSFPRTAVFFARTGLVAVDPANGALIAGDSLVIMRESGELALAPVSPKAFRFNARAQLIPGVVRAYPVLADGRFYVRNDRQLSGFELRARVPAQGPRSQ